ncbi:putative diguanylate phosphodiesterase (EAL domain) with Response Regulator Receiver modulation [Richelia sinica FACHB-800]|uniref:histidine kinase n=1 Tax=Richelia sinica FACHB-800 TaxID=1357546 RepID=A0A975Y6T7_9NOST|nr:response regulator [Richelia sinica]MBD2667155.1 response regulator [Richelia sinica FACHB-800]QXE25604.1 putative diguanylate phosphodiesterase (EAL domain) with Response Regulator Receiver modulation [Richelia sinica FACHB-800]
MTRILIIEDEIQIRNNLEQILQLSGYETITAENGLIGVELAIAHPPDLILCDIMLPELDGYGVLTALRQEKSTFAIPLIFLTAKAEFKDLRQGMELGADDYLTKPFEQSELLRAINTRLERKNTLIQEYTEKLESNTLLTKELNKSLTKQVKETQENFEKSQQVSGIKTDLLQKLIEDLRNPLSNINMAIHMLKTANTPEEIERYISVLQAECSREVQLLNEVEHIQKLLTPENTKILQRWKLLS